MPSQVWLMEKLENKLIDMRELYDEIKSRPGVEVSSELPVLNVTVETTRYYILTERKTGGRQSHPSSSNEVYSIPHT